MLRHIHKEKIGVCIETRNLDPNVILSKMCMSSAPEPGSMLAHTARGLCR